MFPRFIKYPKNKSFFLLGPRGTGKSTWVQDVFKDQPYVDLLNDITFQELLRDPTRLSATIDPSQKFEFIIIDEIQRLPELLNEVHRLIVNKNWAFVLTGSSARKLRQKGVNLLGGRARKIEMHPLTAEELGSHFDLKKSIQVGHLPEAYLSDDASQYLKSYVGIYLREEVQQEALVRNLRTFTNFLEIAAFSQGSVLSVKSVAQDCGIDRKTAESYFQLLDDLLIGIRIPVFQKKSKRKMTSHPKFFYFDVGLFRALRKQGPLDAVEEVEGICLETLVFQEIRALNANYQLEFEMSFWRTQLKQEIDFVLYGPRGLYAIEVKRSKHFRESDLDTLKLFLSDYPQAKGYLFYTGEKNYYFDKIQVIPVDTALKTMRSLI